MIKISLCIPTYNRKELFIRLIDQLYEKIRDSSYARNIEICISDNGSDYDITKIIDGYRDANKNITTKFHRYSQNTGIMNNIKKSVSIAEGDFCLILGDDDMLVKDVSIDYILEILYKTSADIITFPFYSYDGERNNLVYPSKETFKSRLFNLALDIDYDEWFNNILDKGGNSSGLFIFISNVIFKRSNWLIHSAKCDWNSNNVYHQSFIHLKTLLGGSVFQYLDIPLIIRNDTFNSAICERETIYCFNLLTGMNELIRYFFKGVLAEKLLVQYMYLSAYCSVLEAKDISESNKKYLRDLCKDIKHMHVIGKIYLPTHEFSKMEDKNIIVFGSGFIGNKIINKIIKHGYNIEFCVDNDVMKQGTFIGNVNIISIEKSLNIPNSIYVIAVGEKYVVDIYNQLKDEGVSDELIFYCSDKDFYNVDNQRENVIEF